MKVQDWIFSVHFRGEDSYLTRRFAIVGPARASTVEAALHQAGISEDVRLEIRTDATVRAFVEGRLDPKGRGYYTSSSSWDICIGSVHEVLR